MSQKAIKRSMVKQIEMKGFYICLCRLPDTVFPGNLSLSAYECEDCDQRIIYSMCDSQRQNRAVFYLDFAQAEQKADQRSSQHLQEISGKYVNHTKHHRGKQQCGQRIADSSDLFIKYKILPIQMKKESCSYFERRFSSGGTSRNSCSASWSENIHSIACSRSNIRGILSWTGRMEALASVVKMTKRSWFCTRSCMPARNKVLLPGRVNSFFSFSRFHS